MILTDADELRLALVGAEASLTAEREHSARLQRECWERHDELRRELDAARRQRGDFERILLREGDAEGAYERQLAQAIRERDEAREEANRLDDEAIYQRGLYESARAELQRLRRELFMLDEHRTFRDALRATAERQREACAVDFGDWLGMRFHNDNNNNVPHDLIDVMRDQIRKTPLVTDAKADGGTP